MKIKALTSFAGAVSMHLGEVKEIDDSNAAALISCGYAEEVTEAKTSSKKGVKSDENKRDNA